VSAVRPRDDPRALQGHRAGFVTRATADVIDIVLVVVLWVGALWFVGLMRFLVHPRRGIRVPQVPSAITFTCVALLAIAYLGLHVAATGRTFGKRFTGLRVRTSSGDRVGTPRALLRAAVSVIFPIGFLLVLFSERNRSVADIVAATAVVYDWGLSPTVPAGPAAPS
jgi:uncharacterized RDD family membrane protein YckC